MNKRQLACFLAATFWATIPLAAQNRVLVFTTSYHEQWFLKQNQPYTFLSGTYQPTEAEKSIYIDTAQTFQAFLGMGAALTDAAALVLDSLQPLLRQQILEAYFDPETGHGYRFLRLPVHSCDFSTHSYTYVQEGDTTLSSFSIEPDQAHRIPIVRDVMEQYVPDLRIYVSPWSPPAFMKTNHSMLQGGKLKPSFRKMWADYLITYIQEYEKLGIPIWGLTVQNEPMATQRWESCIYTAEEELEFIRNYLGPSLHAAGMTEKKLIAWDHNRDLLFQRASVLMSDTAAAKYIWGLGFHWYETWAGGNPKFDNVAATHQAFPDKALVFTEGCNERFIPEGWHNWDLAERYGISIINDLNAGTVAWTDWNLLLNNQGGPNHTGNFCFAPVHADPSTQSITYTPSYYFLGHFSRFIQENALRVSCSTSHSNLQATAFKNPDGSMVCVVLNPTEQPLETVLQTNSQYTRVQIPARSIQTFIF